MLSVIVFIVVVLLIFVPTFFSVGTGKKAYLLIRHLQINLVALVKNETAETDSKLRLLWEKMRRVRFGKKTQTEKQIVFRQALEEWQKELVLFFERVAPKLSEADRRRISWHLDGYWEEILDTAGKLGVKTGGFPEICWKMPA